MGAKCSGSHKTGLAVNQIEVVLPSYRDSPTESIFKSFDSNNNFLQNFPLTDYQLSLPNITYTSISETNSLEDATNIDFVSVYFSNAILKYPTLYEMDISEEKTQIFLEFYSKLINYMIKGIKNFYKKHSIKEEVSDNVKKLYLVIVGLLYCHSEASEKIQCIYNIISDDKGIIKKTQDNILFFYLIIFTPTFANYVTLLDLQKNYDDKLKTVTLAKRGDYDKYFALKNIEDVFEEFSKGFFEEEMNEDQFMNKIVKEDFAWILTKQGVRSKFRG